MLRRIKEIKFKLLPNTPRVSQTSVALFTLCSVSFLLCAPQNMISPSLSDIALDLGFEESERDLYIGSYMQLAYAVVSLPLCMVAGVLTDHYNRTRLLMIVVIFGGLSIVGFAVFNVYYVMLFLRVIHGIAYGACVPLTYSLMSDLFSSCTRAKMSAYLTVCQGGGTLAAQIFAGYMSPLVNWRIPFLIVGGITILQGLMISQCLTEPIRGVMDTEICNTSSSFNTSLPNEFISRKSKGTENIVSNGPRSTRGRGRTDSAPPLVSRDSIMVIVHMLQIPTVVLMMTQAIPNNIPWGMLSVHMNDFLLFDGHIPAAEATSLIAIFGAGAGLGGVGGGTLGTYLYTLRKPLLPAFMGLTLIGSALIMQVTFSMAMTPDNSFWLTSLVIGTAGTLASINGSLSRAVLLNVVSPFARGAAMSSLTVMTSLGRGFGPAALTSVMHSSHVHRKVGMERLMYLWVLAGILLVMICGCIVRDEENMRAEMIRQMEGSSCDDELLLIDEENGGGDAEKVGDSKATGTTTDIYNSDEEGDISDRSLLLRTVSRGVGGDVAMLNNHAAVEGLSEDDPEKYY